MAEVVEQGSNSACPALAPRPWSQLLSVCASNCTRLGLAQKCRSGEKCDVCVHTYCTVTVQLPIHTQWSTAGYHTHTHMHEHNFAVPLFLPPTFETWAQVQNILNSALFNGAAVEVTAFDAEFCLRSWTKTDDTVGAGVLLCPHCGGWSPKMTFCRGNHFKISNGFHKQLGSECQKLPNRDRTVAETSDADRKHIHCNFHREVSWNRGTPQSSPF